jgi:hypothetical protein
MRRVADPPQYPDDLMDFFKIVYYNHDVERRRFGGPVADYR